MIHLYDISECSNILDYIVCVSIAEGYVYTWTAIMHKYENMLDGFEG